MKNNNNDAIGDIMVAVVLFFSFIFLLATCTGCSSKGFKHLQGSEMVIGLSSPVSSSSVDVSALQMISGQKLEVESGNRVILTARTETEGSYFGVITTKSIYSVEAETTPVCTNSIQKIENKQNID